MSTPPTFSCERFNTGSLQPIAVIKEPEVNLMTWLQLVFFHSQSTSPEDLQTLKELSLSPPNTDNAPEEVQELIERVKEAADKKIFDPKLSPKSQRAYLLIREQLQEKPKCARQLFSSDSNDWG
jgi:hypothetical protein